MFFKVAVVGVYFLMPQLAAGQSSICSQFSADTDKFCDCTETVSTLSLTCSIDDPFGSLFPFSLGAQIKVDVCTPSFTLAVQDPSTGQYMTITKFETPVNKLVPIPGLDIPGIGSIEGDLVATGSGNDVDLKIGMRGEILSIAHTVWLLDEQDLNFEDSPSVKAYCAAQNTVDGRLPIGVEAAIVAACVIFLFSCVYIGWRVKRSKTARAASSDGQDLVEDRNAKGMSGSP